MWIIEDGVFEEQGDVEVALKKEGVPFEYYKGHSYSPDQFFWGSINTSVRVAPFDPTDPKYSLSHMTSLLPHHILNKCGYFMPLGQFAAYWDNHPVFIRPDSGAKKFAGQVIRDCYDLQYLLRTIKCQQMVFIAPVKKIRAEYRLVVGSEPKRIITGSQYRREGNLNISLGPLSDEALNFAESLPQVWMDPFYVMDIAQTEDGKWGVLEFNCLCTSGLYACDPVQIVRALKSPHTI